MHNLRNRHSLKNVVFISSMREVLESNANGCFLFFFSFFCRIVLIRSLNLNLNLISSRQWFMGERGVLNFVLPLG